MSVRAFFSENSIAKVILPIIIVFLGLGIAGWLFKPSIPTLPLARTFKSEDIYQRMEEFGTNQRMGTLFDLLQEAKDRKLDLDHRNAAGLRALEIAAGKDQADAAAAFIVAGSSINAVNSDGDTVIHIAVRNHALHVLKQLRHFVPRLDVRNNDGLTAAELARQLGDDEAVAILTAPPS